MSVKFYLLVNNGKQKILLANWRIDHETLDRDILFLKTGIAIGARLKYKKGKIICESEDGKILSSSIF